MAVTLFPRRPDLSPLPVLPHPQIVLLLLQRWCCVYRIQTSEEVAAGKEMGQTDWERDWWRNMKSQQEQLNRKAAIEQERARRSAGCIERHAS